MGFGEAHSWIRRSAQLWISPLSPVLELGALYSRAAPIHSFIHSADTELTTSWCQNSPSHWEFRGKHHIHFVHKNHGSELLLLLILTWQLSGLRKLSSAAFNRQVSIGAQEPTWVWWVHVSHPQKQGLVTWWNALRMGRGFVMVLVPPTVHPAQGSVVICIR